MASIYICPDCRRKFFIVRDGDYLCDCGKVFFYPPILSTEKACFVTVAEHEAKKREEQELAKKRA